MSSSTVWKTRKSGRSCAATTTISITEDEGGLRRGPWTGEEDNLLIHYISSHGEGRWNLLATRSGLKRTGKSCRLRWLNYLKPDVRRGNLTPQEQLLILELHSKWGNRWSKIAQQLPGRTDNEIKNYWRTRVQKQARHLKIDPNSTQFQQLIRRVWMPRLLQKIHGQSTTTTATTSKFRDYSSSSNYGTTTTTNNNNDNIIIPLPCNSLVVEPPQEDEDDDYDYDEVVPLPYHDPLFPTNKDNASRRSTSTDPSICSSNSSLFHHQEEDMDGRNCYNYYNNNMMMMMMVSSSSNNNQSTDDQCEGYNNVVEKTSYDMVETFSGLFTVIGDPPNTKDPSSSSSSLSSSPSSSSSLSLSSYSSSSSSLVADQKLYMSNGDQNINNHWFAADEFIYGSLWNMDDLSQFGQR